VPTHRLTELRHEVQRIASELRTTGHNIVNWGVSPDAKREFEQIRRRYLPEWDYQEGRMTNVDPTPQYAWSNPSRTIGATW